MCSPGTPWYSTWACREDMIAGFPNRFAFSAIWVRIMLSSICGPRSWEVTEREKNWPGVRTLENLTYGIGSTGTSSTSIVSLAQIQCHPSGYMVQGRAQYS